jgi:subtilisin family serine protease
MPVDPWFPKQWYLLNTGQASGLAGLDHNVVPVWKLGLSGKGVVVSILDDGLEHNHPDLKDNYDPEASHDFNSNDPDPQPRPTWNNENRHGTRCAGEVAAAKNDVCIVGAAFNSKIGGMFLQASCKDIRGINSPAMHLHLYSYI